MSTKLNLRIVTIIAGALLPITPTIVRAAPDGIPSDAVEFQGHWYFAAKANGIHWRNALDKSIDAGGYLACIETEAERAFVNELVDKKSGNAYWLGGYRTANGWSWINEKPIDTGKVTRLEETNLTARVKLKGRQFDRVLSSSAPKPSSNKTTGYVIEWEPGIDVALTLPNSSLPSPATPKPSTADAPIMSTVVLEGNAHAKTIILKKAKVGVKGLLVISLGGDEHAGGASQMSLTSLAASPEKSATISFNQPVGPSMASALKEVQRFIELRHGGWPRGRAMEIAFENKYNPKDGPSAAVACALMLESALTADDLDPQFAVTGDLNADGSVQPIGGVDAKIRGATNRDCTHVALPDSNRTNVFDTILLHGFGPIAEIQVFSIATFDQAIAIASLEKSSKLDAALAAFEEIQSVYQRQPSSFAGSLRHPKMIEKLRAVLSDAPNHLSAAIMLAHAEGTAPKVLSLHGSVSFINGNAYQIVDVIDSQGRVVEKSGIFDENQIADALTQLKQMRPRLDKRTWKWINHLLIFGDLLNEWQTDRPNSATGKNKLVAAVNAAATEVRTERKKLMSNPEVVEELAF